MTSLMSYPKSILESFNLFYQKFGFFYSIFMMLFGDFAVLKYDKSWVFILIVLKSIELTIDSIAPNSSFQ